LSDQKTEVWFYHLERSTLDQVLPGLLEKTLQRGWRALVRVNDAADIDDLDELLWTYRPASFLPHGKSGGDHDPLQPILLSDTADNLNSAQALFIVDDADLGPTEGFARCFIIFDGQDEQSVIHARKRWSSLKDSNVDLAYWRQDDEGRWSRAR